MGIWSIIILLASIFIIFFFTSKFNVNAYLILISVAFFYGMATGIPLLKLIESVKNGFGDMFYKTGLIYLSGIIIGVVLEKTGAAKSIAHTIFNIIGPKRSIAVAATSGYLISIPINCDSGYIILFPMCRALATYIGVTPITLGTALACGLLTTHALVPPTAGPTSATLILGADMGQVIAYSLFISFCAIFLSIHIIKKINCISTQSVNNIVSNVDDLQSIKEELPKVAHSFLPIIYPLLVICLSTIVKSESFPFRESKLISIIAVLGDPTIALICAMFLSFTLIKRTDFCVAFSEWIDEALRDAATIVLVNSAAGAFAEVISVSPLMEQLHFFIQTLPLNIGLLAPFLVALIFKTAQGSSTVAMIATAGIMSPIIASSNINPALCVLAIGSGSMLFSHTNDSFFWVVAQFTGMNVQDMLKYYTFPTAIVGVVAFVFVLILHLLI